MMAMYKVCPYCRKKYEYSSVCSCDGYEKAKQIRQRQYDKYVRKSVDNKRYDSFYHSKEWIRMTEYIKRKYNNSCVMCLIEEGVLVPYDVVHHILEIKTEDGWEHRLDDDMLITLCHSCHSEIHGGRYTQDKINRLIEILNEYKELYEV